MRQPIIAGNWKMFKTWGETNQFTEQFLPLIEGVTKCEVVICPPFTSLAALQEKLAGTKVSYGAQNMHWEEKGAFTGEISPRMLLDLGCKYVILGHSERREYFGETNEIINRKIKGALSHGLTPILCVGEKLEQREAGVTTEVIKEQLTGSLRDIPAANIAQMVLAYEPVWAIGTGKTASSDDAQEVISFIRRTIGELFGDNAANGVRIQYGGSVKPENIGEIMQMPDIDGALVGGASLEPKSFAQIVNY